MPFGIACAVFALTIGLVHGLGISVSARGSHALEVRIDIVYVHEKT